jgi:predicted nucleotide-binding protein
MPAKKSKSGSVTPVPGRTRVSQTDVPRHSLDEALRVPKAINDGYAGRATKPLRVAEAMGIKPTTGIFRTITSAAEAYGLTKGAAFATEISLTPVGKRAVAPTSEGDDLVAKREAFLRPRVIGEFMTRYADAKFPSDAIALNVLEEIGVPRAACPRALELLKSTAEGLGLVRTIKGQLFVDLQGTTPAPRGRDSDSSDEDEGGDDSAPPTTPKLENLPVTTPVALTENRRVFITHGSNKEIVQQLKELLAFGDLVPVVSEEKETGAKPVPDKVMDDMRSCGAAIVHVGAERRLTDQRGEEHVFLNQNVLIEIGAAMALYRRRFILLVERDVKLPSNLQGLYEVRYEGQRLDYEATMKLLKAFSDFKSPPSQ